MEVVDDELTQAHHIVNNVIMMAGSRAAYSRHPVVDSGQTHEGAALHVGEHVCRSDACCSILYILAFRVRFWLGLAKVGALHLQLMTTDHSTKYYPCPEYGASTYC